eukprot:gene44753-55689_t
MNIEIVRKTVSTALVAASILALAPAAHAAATGANLHYEFRVGGE